MFRTFKTVDRIVFDGLRKMMEKHGIELPRGIVADATDAEIEKMVDVALILEPLWENAPGKNWAEVMTRGRIRDLYEKM